MLRSNGDWDIRFIQAGLPGDDRCIMLYGHDGEIVGPMTLQLAEAWMDHFNSTRQFSSERLQEFNTYSRQAMPLGP